MIFNYYDFTEENVQPKPVLLSFKILAAKTKFITFTQGGHSISYIVKCFPTILSKFSGIILEMHFDVYEYLQCKQTGC